MDSGIDRLHRERAEIGEFERRRSPAPSRLTPRQRVDALVDDGTFLELGSLTRSQHAEVASETPGDGLLCGWARVEGCEVAVIAEDPVVLERTDAQVAKQKRHRILNVSAARGTPVIYLADGPTSSGRSFPPATGQLMGYLGPQTTEPRPSDLPTPMVTMIFGACRGRAAELAAASDLVVGAAAGHPANFGAGLVDHLAADEASAIETVRRAFRTLHHAAAGHVAPPHSPLTDDVAPPVPGTVLVDGLFDDGSVISFIEQPALTTGLAQLDGRPVAFAVTSGGGAVDGDALAALLRVARLSRRCGPALLLVQDTGGYDQAVADTPQFLHLLDALIDEIRSTWAAKLVVVTGSGHVLGTFALGGRQLGIDYIAALPFARVAVTDVASFDHSTIVQVTDDAGPQSPWLAAGLGHVDDVLAPSEVRAQLAVVLDLLAHGAAYPPPELDRRGRAVDDIPKV